MGPSGVVAWSAPSIEVDVDVDSRRCCLVMTQGSPEVPPGVPTAVIGNVAYHGLDSVNHCTSKEMPNLDSVNHCTSKTESRFGISKFGIPIEIRSLMSAGIGCRVMVI